MFFLQCLARQRWVSLDNNWKELIVHYVVAIIRLWQAQRLVSSIRNESNLINELKNSSCTNQRPRDYLESPLLEIESGIMILEV